MNFSEIRILKLTKTYSILCYQEVISRHQEIVDKG
jgi:hypothetical protein